MNVFLFQPKRSLFWQQSSCWRSSPHSHPQLGSQRGAPCVDHVRISRFPFCIVRAKKKYPNLFRWSSHDDAFPLCLCFNSIASILDFFLLPLIRENKIFSVDREKKNKRVSPKPSIRSRISAASLGDDEIDRRQKRKKLSQK